MTDGRHFAKGSGQPALPDDGLPRLFSMRFCPYAQRAHLVLSAKKVPHHTIYINLREKPEWLTEVSPLGKVPALQLVAEPGKPSLIESLVIAEYLDQKYPEPPLMPKDALQQALDKILIERFNAVIGSMYKVFMKGTEESPGALGDILSGLDIFEQELKQRGTLFYGGAKPGMVDYMIWPWCERSDMLKFLLPKDKYELDEQRFGLLLKWRERMITDPAVQKHYLDGETHAKFMLTVRKGTPDYDMLADCNKRAKTG